MSDICQTINTTPFSNHSITRQLIQIGDDTPESIPFGNTIHTQQWKNMKKYSNNRKNKIKIELKYPIGLLTTHIQKNKIHGKTGKEIYRIEEIDNMKVKLRNCKDGTQLETTVNNIQPIYRSNIRDHYPENMSKEIKRICLNMKKRPPYKQNNTPNKAHPTKTAPTNPKTTPQNREQNESYTETGDNLHRRTRSVTKKNEIPRREDL